MKARIMLPVIVFAFIFGIAAVAFGLPCGNVNDGGPGQPPGCDDCGTAGGGPVGPPVPGPINSGPIKFNVNGQGFVPSIPPANGGGGGGSCPLNADAGGLTRFKPYTGNAHRNVDDLTVWGSVGEHQLAWQRSYTSREIGSSKYYFGFQNNWRHSYQWEIADAGSSPAKIDIFYPDGTVNRFQQVSTNEWVGTSAGVRDRVFQSGNNFTLQRRGGYQYQFDLLTNGYGQTYYQMQSFKDTQQNQYDFTYTNGVLSRVTEPAGRYLQITYTNLSITRGTTTGPNVLHTISSTPASGWNEVTVSFGYARQYLRYFAPNGSQSVVSEIQFIAEDGTTVLSGSTFGTSPAVSATNTYDKAFDGDTNTWFQYSGPIRGFTGIDLGSGNTNVVGKIRFFPRPGHEADMVGGSFQAFYDYPQTVTVITKVESSDGRSITYNYSEFDDPALPNTYQLLTAVNYGDGTSAAYTHAQTIPDNPPHMITATDPRHPGRAPKIKYDYYDDAGTAFGYVKNERSLTTDDILSTLTVYGGNNSMPMVTTPGGSTNTWLIYVGGHVYGTYDSFFNSSWFWYDNGNYGFLTNMWDNDGRVTSRVPSAYDNDVKITLPDGGVRSWSRDTLDLVTAYTNELGQATIYTRDGSHRVTRIDYADASYETFTYNSFGQIVTHRMRSGGTEGYGYSTNGLLAAMTNALGYVTTYSYNTNDLLSSVTDARSDTTSYEYNERGLVTKITNPDSSYSTMAYDSFGNRTNRVDELGHTWSYAFDEFRRMTSTTDPLGRTTTYEYEEVVGGSPCSTCSFRYQPTRITLPSGKKTEMAYDGKRQRISVTVGASTGDAATTSYRYDKVGNVTNVVDGRGKVWTFAYDSRNRRTSSKDPLGNSTLWTYDVLGNNTGVIRPDGGVTTNFFDSVNRLTETRDPLNQVTKFGYDSADNLVSLTDARNNVYSNAYDVVNQKLAMIYPDNSRESWGYDAVGNNTSYTNRAGTAKSCTFDSRNRETLCDWSDSTPDVGKSYDSAGRMTALSNSVSILTYSYDNANQLLSESQNISGSSGAKTVSYTYNTDGNRATLTYPDGTVVTNAYTARNQLSSITADGPPPLATYTYDLNGNRTAKTLENNTSVSYQYDDANRLLSITNKTGSTPFASFIYGYNSVNNRTYVKRETGKGDVYRYDPTDQVTNVLYEATNPDSTPSNPSRTVGYVYDATGNRTSLTDNGTNTSYSANNLNQYTAIGSDSPSYDANGNLTNSASWAYSYDAQNRLTTASGGSGGTNSASFFYDGRNRCVVRAINGTTNRLYYSDWNLIDERNTSDTQLAKYIHGAVIDEILARITTNSAHYYHRDAITSTTHLTDSSGSVAESYSYDVFGTPMIFDSAGTNVTSTTVGNRFLFTGREWTTKINLYDYRNRSYSESLGRFVQIDPLRFLDGPNLYLYVHNAPVDRSDPLGLRDCAAEQIQCFRRCYNATPPWPCKWHKHSHYAYCQTKCLAEYMECLAEEAARWLAAHPEAVIGTIVVIGGITFVVATGGSGALILVPAVAL